jgi:acetyl coenzyme A synthetase (ADP forming)-like protein
VEETYPSHRSADVALRDGSTVHIRPVRPEDEQPLCDFFSELSPDARGFRFFTAAASMERAAGLAVDIDYSLRYGLVATRGDDDHIVGHGTYLADGPERAEVAFAVADRLVGRGLGTILLAHLAEVAAENRIPIFEAEVLPGNSRMVEVFRESGFPAETQATPGAIHIELATSFSPEAVERFQQRDRLAAAAAVRRFLAPQSIAVIGASRRRGTVSGEVFHNILDGGYGGVVYPVNPSAEVVQSVRAYPDVLSVPGEVDLAVICVPAAFVTAAARDCAEKGVPAIVVISAGFGETGEEGLARQRELVEICREAGIRLIGPNCLGVLNTEDGISLNATFAPGMPPPGGVGFVTQSGALGLTLIDLAGSRGLGVSSFASIGNRADITANDMLEYWEEDERTRVAMLYIESFSNPRRFSTVARRIGRQKPVVVVKSGRSAAGARATESHTGALISASDVTVDALFDQVGVIRTDSLAELLDVASLLANQPLPGGSRVGIITNAGGPGIMCADTCEAAGLEVPPLPEEVKESLRGILAPEAGLGNPVDMIATATAEQYRDTITAMAAWEGIDALIVIFIRPLLTRAEDVADAVQAACASLPRDLPVQAVFMSAEDHAAIGSAGGVPVHLYPEDAARALGRVMRHVNWRARPHEEPPVFDDTDVELGAVTIARALERGGGWLGMTEITELLGHHGIAMPAWRSVSDPVAAGHAADELGGRIALKAAGPEIVHKTDLGAVRVGLRGAAEVSWAAVEMDEELEAAGVARQEFIVQSMVDDGAELLVGVVLDPVFGPVLACGAGGTRAELLKDVAVRICPLNRQEAREMIRSLATYPLLTGFRGAPEADLGALEDLLLRLSAMVEAHHEIVELDLNPVMAGPYGALAVDARIRVQAAPPPRPWPSTWKIDDA